LTKDYSWDPAFFLLACTNCKCRVQTPWVYLFRFPPPEARLGGGLSPKWNNYQIYLTEKNLILNCKIALPFLASSRHGFYFFSVAKKEEDKSIEGLIEKQEIGNYKKVNW